jgi:elongation factor 1-beta
LIFLTKMAIFDVESLKADTGLKSLNDFLADKSYMAGNVASQEDCKVFNALSKSPAQAFPHASRWYEHISSFTSNERSKWPGEKSANDDDFDLFGDETAEESKAKDAMKQAPAKKEKKQVINKSTLVIDIKPRSLSTDLSVVEREVRSIKIEGLEWASASKRVPVAYGLQKLQMGCVIIDDLVATDDIMEKIECIGLTEEQAEVYRSRHHAEEQEEEETTTHEEDDEVDEPGLVQSAEIVSFQKL